MATRICLITRPDLQPTVHGAAVKIIRTAEALSRQGATVYIVTNDRVWFYVAEGGMVNRRRYPQALLSLTNCPPALKERLAQAGLPTYWHGLEALLYRLGYPRDEHFLYQPIVDPDFWIRVLYVGWAHRIDVYQAEFPGYAVPAILASRLLGGQSALVEHNIEYARLRDTTELPEPVLERLKRIELWCARTVDHVITCSDVDRDLLIQEGVPGDRIGVIHHGVELEAYRRVSGQGIRRRYRIPEEAPLLVFHGTLHYWPNTIAVKHIAEDLLPRLRARGIPVKAMICGMNPPRYYAHPDITFTEVVQDLPEHLAAADVAVVPLDDGGGTRLKILEYFAAGLPVVSTPKGAEGIPARAGVELEIAADMDRFAELTAALLTDRERARKLGAAGRDFVQAYDWDAVCAGYLTRYARGVAHFPIDVPILSRFLHDRGKRISTYFERLNAVLRAEGGDRGEARGTTGSGMIGTEPRVTGGTGRGEKNEGQGEDGGSAPPHPAQGLAPLTPVVAPAMARVIDHLPVHLHPTKPLTLIMMINRGCNLRCDFCDLYENAKYMPLPDALRVIDEAAALGVKTLVLTGGEPFLHPGLWEMVKRARAHGMGTNVTTNGTYIERHLEKLLDAGLESVSVSLDGLQETHEALRKVKGCFDATRKGLELLKRHGVHANIYFVITGQNVHELEPVYELARDGGFGFDFWPVNDAHHLYIVTPEHRALYREAIDALAAVDPAVAAKRDYYYAGLDYHAGWDRRVRCLGLIEQFAVNLEGDLVPCCVWDNTDLKVGSTRDTPLETLWYSDTAAARRRQIFDHGCHNRCFNHSLYEFQLSTGLSFVVGEGREA